MSEPGTWKDPFEGLIHELISAQNALNMEPEQLAEPEGPYLSDRDRWAKDAYQHIVAALALVDRVRSDEASRGLVVRLSSMLDCGNKGARAECHWVNYDGGDGPGVCQRCEREAVQADFAALAAAADDETFVALVQFADYIGRLRQRLQRADEARQEAWEDGYAAGVNTASGQGGSE